MTEKELVVRLIPLELVNQFTKMAQHHIAAALKHSDITVEQAKVFLSNGTWNLLIVQGGPDWKDIVGVYTVAISNEPNDRVATIVTAGGPGLARADVFGQLCAIVQSLGATKVQALATPAAARLYRRVGLFEKAILVEKKLWVE